MRFSVLAVLVLTSGIPCADAAPNAMTIDNTVSAAATAHLFHGTLNATRVLSSAAPESLCATIYRQHEVGVNSPPGCSPTALLLALLVSVIYRRHCKQRRRRLHDCRRMARVVKMYERSVPLPRGYRRSVVKLRGGKAKDEFKAWVEWVFFLRGRDIDVDACWRAGARDEREESLRESDNSTWRAGDGDNAGAPTSVVGFRFVECCATGERGGCVPNSTGCALAAAGSDGQLKTSAELTLGLQARRLDLSQADIEQFFEEMTDEENAQAVDSFASKTSKPLADAFLKSLEMPVYARLIAHEYFELMARGNACWGEKELRDTTRWNLIDHNIRVHFNNHPCIEYELGNSLLCRGTIHLWYGCKPGARLGHVMAMIPCTNVLETLMSASTDLPQGDWTGMSDGMHAGARDADDASLSSRGDSQRPRSAAEREIQIGLRDTNAQLLEDTAPPFVGTDGMIHAPMAAAVADPNDFGAEERQDTSTARTQFKDGFLHAGDGLTYFRVAYGTEPPAGAMIFTSDAKNYAIEDGSTPAPLYGGEHPQGAGKYAVTSPQLETFLNRIHRMRITMSFDFSKASSFGFIADVDLHGAVSDELRAAINPDNLHSTFQQALQQYFEDSGEVVVMTKQQGSGFHIAAPKCIFDKAALQQQGIAWRRLYEDIINCAKNKLEEQTNVAVPPETFDMLESGQLRMAGVPKYNALNWATAYAPVGTHPRELTKVQMAELSAIVRDPSVGIPLRETVRSMPRLQSSTGGGSSSSTGVTTQAFGQVAGSGAVLAALANTEGLEDCTYTVSTITGGANDGCYRLKVNEVDRPCLFHKELHHRQQNGDENPMHLIWNPDQDALVLRCFAGRCRRQEQAIDLLQEEHSEEDSEQSEEEDGDQSDYQGDDESEHTQSMSEGEDEGEDEGEECSICLAEIDPLANDATTTPCGHKFHTACLNQALQVNNLCPNCRTPVNNGGGGGGGGGPAVVPPAPHQDLFTTIASQFNQQQHQVSEALVKDYLVTVHGGGTLNPPDASRPDLMAGFASRLLDFNREYVTVSKAAQGTVYTCFASEHYVWQKRTGQTFTRMIDAKIVPEANRVCTAAMNLMTTRYTDFNRQLPLNQQPQNLKDDPEFQVDFRQMERCERLRVHLSGGARLNEFKHALMDFSFDHAVAGSQITDRLTAVGDDKKGLLKFSDGAYEIATSTFRAYTAGDCVCAENTFGYPFPGRGHDGESKATLDELYTDTCLDCADMTKTLLDIETLCVLHNSGKQVFLVEGKPDSGKTTWRKLMSLCAGSQSAHGPGTYWTTDRDATKPDEHKTGASGKTVFSCEEPPDSKPIILNPLKEWSGGGDQSSRVNHGNEQNFINTPSVVICFNEVLFDPVAEGVRNRLYVVNFPARFVAAPDPAHEHERHASGIRDLLNGGGEQAEKLRDERMRMILDHLEASFKPDILDPDGDGSTREVKIPEPQCVQAATKKLFEDLNPVRKFLTDGPLQLTDDDDKKMCYGHFKAKWTDDQVDEYGKIPNGKRLQKYMEQMTRPDGRPIRLSDDKLRFQSVRGGPFKYYMGVEGRPGN